MVGYPLSIATRTHVLVRTDGPHHAPAEGVDWMQHNVESNGALCVRSESCGCIEQRAVAASPILRPAKELLCECGEPQVQLIQTATGGLSSEELVFRRLATFDYSWFADRN